jgi:hypothetical protein
VFAVVGQLAMQRESSTKHRLMPRDAVNFFKWFRRPIVSDSKVLL